MFRVMIVDDEPFNIKGLMVLIDWAKEGFEVAHTAANGQEALDYLRRVKDFPERRVDLILADIRMPVMDGLQLLEIIRREAVSDADFVILSGYAEFQFAQRAVNYGCQDYILKPVQSGQLLELLHRTAAKREESLRREENGNRMKGAFLEQNIAALLGGRHTQENMDFVAANLRASAGVRYVHVRPDFLLLEGGMLSDDLADDEKARQKEKIYDNCRNFLGAAGNHCFRDRQGLPGDYEIGLIYGEAMAVTQGLSLNRFMESLLAAAVSGVDCPVALLVGKQVESLDQIAQSYGSACMLRSLQGFQARQDIYYYENELQIKPSGSVLCKENLDLLIKAVELNDKAGINRHVDSLYEELDNMPREGVSLNINYLMFQLVHLAVEQDETVDQEEVMRYIVENVMKGGFVRGSRPYLRKFAGEYAEYLNQLRGKVSRGVLKEVEREIREHYADNLTLRDLSKKYFINSSYLGQIFRKKYGLSFKDYLNDYRIGEAAALLLKTDKKISQVAEETGYRDSDYFVSRFIAVKGCTPAKYRKQNP